MMQRKDILNGGLKKPGKYVALCEQQTIEFAKLLAETPRPNVVALQGDLGSGKTTFAKGFIGQITGTPHNLITSPTFSYMHPYGERRNLLYHFDCYRLKNMDQFINLGFIDYLENHCLIEWPEKIHPLLPKDTVIITITKGNHPTTRMINWAPIHG